MKRNMLFAVFTCALVAAMAARIHGGQGPAGAGKDAGEASKIQIGYAIAPVPLDLQGKNPALVGLGSYVVNAQGDCAGCHSNPQYTPTGDPHLGQPEESDRSEERRVGKECK